MAQTTAQQVASDAPHGSTPEEIAELLTQHDDDVNLVLRDLWRQIHNQLISSPSQFNATGDLSESWVKNMDHAKGKVDTYEALTGTGALGSGVNPNQSALRQTGLGRTDRLRTSEYDTLSGSTGRKPRVWR